MQYLKNENIVIETILGVWHWTLLDRSRPLGGETDHTFGQHGVLDIFDNSFGLRTEEKQGLCVPSWNGAEEGGRWLWGPVYLLEEQEAGNIWFPGPELWPLIFGPTKPALQPQERAPDFPVLVSKGCRQPW